MSYIENSKWVSARKPHRCEYCRYPIVIGENTLNVKGMWENEWQNYYLHVECNEEITREAHLNGGEWEFSFGDGEPPERLRPKTDKDFKQFLYPLATGLNREEA